MHILISNDDGVHAPGIIALKNALQKIAKVTVVAPEYERSGASSALTLDRPLRPVEIEENVWSINGTPADCVYIALNGMFPPNTFDVVVSGINSGPNLGDDVLYSGTVGAAFEGRDLGLPALAISLAGPHVKSYRSPDAYQKAAEWIAQFIQNGLPELPKRHIININIPDIEHYAGMQLTRQGNWPQKQPTVHQLDPRGRNLYWINLIKQPTHEAKEKFMSDFEAIEQGYVSLTPIRMDFTNHEALDNWSKSLQSETNSIEK